MESVVLSVLKSFLRGIRDSSLIGLWPVFLLMKRNEKIRKQLLHCVFLNGFVLLFSIIIFEYVVLPAIQCVAELLYSLVINDPSDSGVLLWLGIILWYIFTWFWVVPMYWMSKPINAIWFQDIATEVFEETKRQELRRRKPKNRESLSLSRSLSRFLADNVSSLVVEMLFLVQANVVGLVPGIGGVLSLLHLALLYALYSFEYKWVYEGLMIHQRAAIVEKEWPYFLGYGLPLALATILSGSVFIGACIFGILFPLFLVSASYATPTHTNLPRIPVFGLAFGLANFLSNKLFSNHKPLPRVTSN